LTGIPRRLLFLGGFPREDLAMNAPASMIKHFLTVHDPRINRTKEHKLIDVLVIAVVGVICGAETWDAVELVAKSKLAWLKQYLELKNGIPSHDTIGRVMSRVAPLQLERAFAAWMSDVAELSNGEVVAIDGKTLRRSFDKRNDKPAIHMVSAWATKNGVVLGQAKVDEKSNEITAIPKLLELLNLKGCVVTIDAMGCQTEIAQKIIDQKADYVFGLKGNQGNTLKAVADYFEGKGEKLKPVATSEKGHGREETRSCKAASASAIPALAKWPGCSSAAAITSTRTINGKTTTETRYFLSSLKPGAKTIMHAIRAHWGIENKLHWVLDAQFNEDQSRIRSLDAPENLAVMRHTALNLLRKETTFKGSMKMKRLRCSLSNDYLKKVLFEGNLDA